MTLKKSRPYERACSRICFLAARSSSGNGARVWEAIWKRLSLFLIISGCGAPRPLRKKLFLGSIGDAGGDGEDQSTRQHERCTPTVPNQQQEQSGGESGVTDFEEHGGQLRFGKRPANLGEIRRRRGRGKADA